MEPVSLAFPALAGRFFTTAPPMCSQAPILFFNFLDVIIYLCIRQMCRRFTSCGQQELLAHCSLRAPHCRVFSCHRAQALGRWAQRLQPPGPSAQAPKLWLTRFVVPPPVRSSWTKGRIRVSCISRQILHRWATREAQAHILAEGLLVTGSRRHRAGFQCFSRDEQMQKLGS